MIMSSSGQNVLNWKFDRCGSSSDCTVNAECINDSGDYKKCCCKQGFKGNGYASCTDINECQSNRGRGPCAHRCTNSRGSYKCSCWLGYSLMSDGKKCKDIDECKTNNGDCE